MTNTILAAVDGSAPSLAAVDLAAEWAARLDAELILVEVVPPQSAMPDDAALREFARAEHMVGGVVEAEHEMASDTLEEARRSALARGAKRVRAIVLSGDPAEQILTSIDANAVDAVFLGTRGRGPLARLLLGSVSQKVASLATCPVTIVPARRPAA